MLPRPRHIWMNPEVAQLPLTFTTAQTVYSQRPAEARRDDVRPAVLCRERERQTAPEFDIVSDVIVDVAGQLAMIDGEL